MLLQLFPIRGAPQPSARCELRRVRAILSPRSWDAPSGVRSIDECSKLLSNLLVTFRPSPHLIFPVLKSSDSVLNSTLFYLLHSQLARVGDIWYSPKQSSSRPRVRSFADRCELCSEGGSVGVLGVSSEGGMAIMDAVGERGICAGRAAQELVLAAGHCTTTTFDNVRS